MDSEPSPAGRPERTAAAASGVLVIVGASGDLTKRLLMPAVYNLACDGLLPEAFAIVGMGREPMTTAEFRNQQRAEIGRFKTRVTLDERRWQWLESRLHYTGGEFNDPAAFARLKALVDDVAAASGAAGNTLLYLAISPIFSGS
jgi:glucose-6-phosphate 1-dehydrogenase